MWQTLDFERPKEHTVLLIVLGEDWQVGSSFNQCTLQLIRSIVAVMRDPERSLYCVIESLSGNSKIGQINANQGAAFVADAT